MKCTFAYPLTCKSLGLERVFYKDSSISFVPDKGMSIVIENVNTHVLSTSWCHDLSILTIHLAGYSHDTEDSINSNAEAWASDGWTEE